MKDLLWVNGSWTKGKWGWQENTIYRLVYYDTKKMRVASSSQDVNLHMYLRVVNNDYEEYEGHPMPIIVVTLVLCKALFWVGRGIISDRYWFTV